MQLFICKFNLLEGACSKDPLKREDIINFLFSVFVIVIKKTGYYQSLSKKYQNMIKIQHYLFLLNYCNGIHSLGPRHSLNDHIIRKKCINNIIIGVGNPDDQCTQDCPPQNCPPGGNPEVGNPEGNLFFHLKNFVISYSRSRPNIFYIFEKLSPLISL